MGTKAALVCSPMSGAPSELELAAIVSPIGVTTAFCTPCRLRRADAALFRWASASVKTTKVYQQDLLGKYKAQQER